jgi:hypothetical protein
MRLRPWMAALALAPALSWRRRPPGRRRPVHGAGSQPRPDHRPRIASWPRRGSAKGSPGRSGPARSNSRPRTIGSRRSSPPRSRA